MGMLLGLSAQSPRLVAALRDEEIVGDGKLGHTPCVVVHRLSMRASEVPTSKCSGPSRMRTPCAISSSHKGAKEIHEVSKGRHQQKRMKKELKERSVPNMIQMKTVKNSMKTAMMLILKMIYPSFSWMLVLMDPSIHSAIGKKISDAR